jgi:vancomycin permeability regulator SanA
MILCAIIVLGLAGAVSLALIIRYVDGYPSAYIYTDLAELPEADAILVLGAFVSDGGVPSRVLAERLDNALTLYNAGKAPKIILSGDHGTKEYDEVNVMKDYMTERGVPREVLFLDHAGFNTYDSMYRAKEIFCAESLIISTQRFHINRSVYIARKLGIDARGFPAEKWADYYQKQYGFREFLAKVKAFADVEVFKRKPRFLGEKIPISGSGLATEG